MGKVQPIRSGAPTRSPERQRLADAAAHYKAVMREVEATKTAISQANHEVHVCESRIGALKAEVEEAKANAARHRAAQLMGESGAPPKSIKEVRAELQDAEDNLDAARGTYAALKRQLQELEPRPIPAKLLVESAVHAVLASEVNATAAHERFEKAFREYADARRVLRWFEEQKLANAGLLKSYSHEHEWPDLLGAKAWVEVAKALEGDADTALPRIDLGNQRSPT